MEATLSRPAYRSDSLAAHLLGYFANNPRIQQVTLEDISQRFDFTRANIHSALALALEKGDLTRGRDDDGEYWYGPPDAATAKKPASKVDTAAETARLLQRAVAKVERKARAKEPILEVETLQIDRNVPLPAAPRKNNDWLSLIRRMTPNDSVHLNMAHLVSFKKAAKTFGGKWKFISDPDGIKFRVWFVEPPQK